MIIHIRKQGIHKWFAWYPVKLDKYRYAWLTVVNREFCAASLLYKYTEGVK